MHAPAKMRGHFRLDVYEGDIEWRRRSDGILVRRNPLVEVLEGDNTVDTTGKSLLLDRLFALAGVPTAVTSMGVGTDSTAAAVGDTKLNPTVTGTVFIQAFDSLPTRAGLTVTAVSTFATGSANFAWAELGMFNGTVNGTSTLFDRIAPIGPFTKTASVSIVVTTTLTQS